MRCVHDNSSLVNIMPLVWSGDAGDVFLMPLGGFGLRQCLDGNVDGATGGM